MVPLNWRIWVFALFSVPCGIFTGEFLEAAFGERGGALVGIGISLWYVALLVACDGLARKFGGRS